MRRPSLILALAAIVLSLAFASAARAECTPDTITWIDDATNTVSSQVTNTGADTYIGAEFVILGYIVRKSQEASFDLRTGDLHARADMQVTYMAGGAFAHGRVRAHDTYTVLGPDGAAPATFTARLDYHATCAGYYEYSGPYGNLSMPSGDARVVFTGGDAQADSTYHTGNGTYHDSLEVAVSASALMRSPQRPDGALSTGAATLPGRAERGLMLTLRGRPTVARPPPHRWPSGPGRPDGRTVGAVTEFSHTELLPLGPDATTYRKLDLPGVQTIEAGGHTFLQVAPQTLTALAAQAMHDIAHFLRPGHLAQLARILDDPEASPNDRFVALDLLKNANIAAGGVLPMCQDTGTAIIKAKKGQYVLTGGGDEAALARGIFDTYQHDNLRYSQMAPLTLWEETNTGTNLPAEIKISAVIARM